MEKLRKNRTVYRSLFTKVLNTLESLLEENNVLKLKAQLTMLETKYAELSKLDKEIYEALLETDTSEEDLINEVTKADEYANAFNEMTIKVNNIILSQNNDHISCASELGSVENNSSCTKQRKFKLPLLQLKKFDGNLLNWLQFWAQFSKIHNDDDIVDEDKFQYLLQAIEPNTRAYDLVISFPPTGSNYGKVIDSLKSRFGKEDLLVEVYVRELLKLVLQNVLDKQSKMSLQSLYDKLESHLRAIDSLGVTTEKCAAMLFPLVESCMPEDLLRAWQRSTLHTGDEPKSRLENLMRFMRSEVEGEQRIGLAMSSFGLENYNKSSKRDKPNLFQPKKLDVASATNLVSAGTNRPKLSFPIACIFCDKSHKSQDCFVAQKMDLEERRKILNEKRACFYCLRLGHCAKDCKANVKCVLCKKKHFLLMCSRFQLNPTRSKDVPDGDSISDKPSGVNRVMLDQSNELADKSEEVSVATTNVLMQTVLVNVENHQNGLVRPARVLFDSGSQQSYVTTEFAKKMGFQPLGERTIVHTLFGNIKSKQQVHKMYRLHLSSKIDSYSCELDVLDQPAICGTIPHVPPGPWLKELKEQQIFLSDIEEDNLPISILIGADMMGKLLTGNKYQLSCGLVAIETLLGWTLMGKLEEEKPRDANSIQGLISMFVRESDISDLWSLDTIGIKDPYEHQSKEDKHLALKKDFLLSTKVNDEGRYEVSLPWIEGHVPLPSNKALSEIRLSNLLKKLDKENLYDDYNDVLNQWVRDQIIEKVPEDEMNNSGCYLPHRPVVKETSTTTRIRPVFDASAHESKKPSINDCLESGPNLMELIPSVMMRFREGKFGVIADISKAFLQISIDPQDREFLRFIWYNKSEDIFETYRHKRLVFGLKCSPYLLGAVIELHLQTQVGRDTFLLNKLSKSFYVDNVSTSFDSKEEVDNFVLNASDVMAKGKFDLRGWQSTIDSTEIHQEPKPIHANVLGVKWDVKSDKLYINVSFLKEFDVLPLTKRKILSLAHRLFDPIGFISPVTLYPKLLLQKTWKKQIGWDTEVDEEIAKEFFEWFKFLPLIEEINIPRWIGKTTKTVDNCSLHTFCDGSKLAYAAVVYLRVVKGDEVSVQLIAAKARVTPMKDISIPRIELLAATVGARLTKSVKDAMDWSDMPCYFWTDSTTVLSWINQDSKWKIFVQNRVTEIKQITQTKQWNFVPGHLNPADLPSRGCTAKELLESKWHEGPEWLKKDMDEWPKCDNMTDIVCEEEIVVGKKCTPVVNCVFQDSIVLEEDITKWFSLYFSQYMKIVRLVAWVFRFIGNCKQDKCARLNCELTATEIEKAETYLFKEIQKESFSSIYDSKISTLNPILDESGLIRLETKLCNKEDSYGFRYPIVLPSTHKIVQSLVIYHHEKNCHAGVQVLLNILRENYWILGGRKALRSIISKCVKCKRQKAKRLETKAGMLPLNRLREAAVFEITGTDFAGPIFLRNRQKAWICLFTCAVYRAVHFELVTSLSTDAFLQAFRRFIARRGRPHIVYSDNGTNYTGTSNALKGINWEEIRVYSSVHRIEWKFNPPTAAWWGGWWERLVRLTKELLRRVLGKACLDYQEMITVLCDCEVVINSRPLTYLYESEAELVPLTPNHFLHDLTEFGVPDIDKIEETSLSKRQKYLQELRNDLRKRFRSEYLGQLVHKVKPNLKYGHVNVGDVVLVECENKKRIDWPLALIVEKLPDKKGVTRLVKIKTAHGILLRPIQKLYPLEVSQTYDKDNLKSKMESANKNCLRKSNQETPKTDGDKELTTRCGRSVKLPSRYALLFE